MCRYDEITLPPRPASAGQSRAWISEVLAAWDLPGVVEDLRLAVTELVSNAVLHARTVVRVVLSIADGVVELSVGDRDAASPRPQPRPATDSATGGRGLLMIEAMAEEWGVTEHRHGKEVWMRLRPPSGWRYAAQCVCAPDDGGDALTTASGRRVVRMDPGSLPGED